MSDANIEELVTESMSQGKFSIINVLKDRAYPSEEVTVYINEDVAYNASKLQEKIDALDGKFKISEQEKEKLKALRVKRTQFMRELESSKYVFSMQGISEGKREELLTIATDKFPVEYDETKNSLTGEVTKKEIENKDRDRLFTTLLWREHIKKITAPDGSVQEQISAEDVMALRNGLPIAGVGSLNEVIEKLRVSTALFMYKVDEDFLAKS